MFCKYCGENISEGAKFCSKCGELLKEENLVKSDCIKPKDEQDSQAEKKSFCKYCGKKLSSNAKFCTKCGKSLGAEGVVRKTEERLVDNNEKELSLDNNNDSQSQTYATNENLAIRNDIQDNYTDQNFTVGHLLAEVFKIHTAKERDEILRAGMFHQEEEIHNIAPGKMQPWLYSRVFLILFAVFGVFEVCLFSFENTNIMPGIMIVGSTMIPFSMLTLYFELNIYKDISFYKTIGLFLLGGSVSLLFTLVLYSVMPSSSGGTMTFGEASLVSIIEEVGKVVIVMMILSQTKKVTVLHGLLIGGAIGCGFAAFESAGYAFNVYLDAHDWNTRADLLNASIPWYMQKYSYEDSWKAMNSVIFLRAILAVGGHTAWAAITGAAFAKNKKIDFGFLLSFGFCFFLHAMWDWGDWVNAETQGLRWFFLAGLCLAAWWAIVKLISDFVEENR